MRKTSQKALVPQDRSRKDTRNSDNEYYLPHPQVKILRVNRDGEGDQDREKIHIKCPRKQSHNQAPTPVLSKPDFQNHSKEMEGKNYATKKVERKVRSTSSGQTPKKALSKSAFKLQLTSRKQEGGPKRITLQLETPTTKKLPEKPSLQQLNYDSYYSTRPVVESKSIRTLRRPDSARPLAADLQQLLVRCKLVIEQYSDQLQSVRRENLQLQEENQRLRLQRSEGRP